MGKFKAAENRAKSVCFKKKKGRKEGWKEERKDGRKEERRKEKQT